MQDCHFKLKKGYKWNHISAALVFTVCLSCVSDIKSTVFMHSKKNKNPYFDVESGWKPCWNIFGTRDPTSSGNTFTVKHLFPKPNLYVDAVPSISFSICYWLINIWAKSAWHRYNCPPHSTTSGLKLHSVLKGGKSNPEMFHSLFISGQGW